MPSLSSRKRMIQDVYKRQVPHRNRQQDIDMAQALGLDAYLAQLEEKGAILDALLAGYNDGRRKTLFHTAVYLLPLEDLRAVITSLNSRPDLEDQPIKERAVAAVELLQEAAYHQMCIRDRPVPLRIKAGYSSAIPRCFSTASSVNQPFSSPDLRPLASSFISRRVACVRS